MSLEPKVRGAAEQKGMFDDRGKVWFALAAAEIPEGGRRDRAALCRGETFMQLIGPKVPQEINGEYSGLASVAQSFPLGNAETIETGTTTLSAMETELLCHFAAITHMI